MGKKFDYKEWVSKINTLDTVTVLQEIKKVLADEEFADNQKMVAIGFLIDANKEEYVAKMKCICTNKDKQITDLKSNIRQLKEQLRKENKKPYIAPQTKKTGKKVVVIRHKK